jgi:hypothetical protein
VNYIKNSAGRFGLPADLDRATMVKGATVQQWDDIFTGGLEHTISFIRLRLAKTSLGLASSSQGDQLATRMLLEGILAILQSDDFVSVQKFAELSKLDENEAGRELNDWLCAKKVFALDVDNRLFFPRYAFDFSGRVRVVGGMARVIEIFANAKDAVSTALWFLADNSYLAGGRPKDVLQIAPEAVVSSAIFEVSEDRHG